MYEKGSYTLECLNVLSYGWSCGAANEKAAMYLIRT